MEKIVIEAKQLRAALMSAFGLFMLLVSLMLCIFSMKEGSSFITFISFIFILFFGVFFLVLLCKQLEAKPLLTITFDGIIDNSTVNPFGYIAYQDIEKFCIISLSGKKVIGAELKDTQVFIDKLPSTKQGTARSNLNMQCPPITIRTDRAKDITTEDIYTLLKKRLDDNNSLYD